MSDPYAGLRPISTVRENDKERVDSYQNSAIKINEEFQQPVTIWSEPFRPVSCAVSISHLVEGSKRILEGLQHSGISEFATVWAALTVIAVVKQLCLELKPYWPFMSLYSRNLWRLTKICCRKCLSIENCKKFSTRIKV